MNKNECLGAASDAGHLLACAECRADARAARGWDEMPRTEETELPILPSEAFLGRVLRALEADRERTFRQRALVAAVAALLFFFFLGTGIEHTKRTSAEESYAQLTAPSDVEQLLPQ
jgi:hypothetical protein